MVFPVKSSAVAHRHWCPLAGDVGRQKHPLGFLVKVFKLLFMNCIYLFSRAGCKDKCTC